LAASWDALAAKDSPTAQEKRRHASAVQDSRGPGSEV